jgi:hypothetical protein
MAALLPNLVKVRKVLWWVGLFLVSVGVVGELRAAGAASLVPRLNLAPNPSFEFEAKRLGGWCPLGVVPTGQEDRVRCSEVRSLEGGRALEIRPGPFDQDPPFSGARYYADYNGGEGASSGTERGLC